jgi:hypothetical protein
MHPSPQLSQDRYITAVDYRHVLPTAYLRVVGHTRREAERYAKRVGGALLRELPTTAEVRVPRFRGTYTDQAVFEIPILIGECESAARAVLSRFVLRGSV